MIMKRVVWNWFIQKRCLNLKTNLAKENFQRRKMTPGTWNNCLHNVIKCLVLIVVFLMTAVILTGLYCSRCNWRLVDLWRHTGSDESVSDRYSKKIESPPPSWNTLIKELLTVVIESCRYSFLSRLPAGWPFVKERKANKRGEKRRRSICKSQTEI